MSLENEIIDYQNNKDEILHWSNLKGEYRYHSVIRFLRKNSIDCSWDNITYYIKYDKRILINAFKYIVFLEELFKSFIIQNLSIKQSVLINYKFSKALEMYLSIGEKANYDGIDLETLNKEKDTIITLRNRVVHNKILLDRIYNKHSLGEALQIFSKILPISYRTGYIKDINSCAKGIVDSLWHITLCDC